MARQQPYDDRAHCRHQSYSSEAALLRKAERCRIHINFLPIRLPVNFHKRPEPSKHGFVAMNRGWSIVCDLYRCTGSIRQMPIIAGRSKPQSTIQIRGFAMATEVKAAFRKEMGLAKSAIRNGALADAKFHLERAHILGQRWYAAHVISHYHMLRVAMIESDWREARGQIIRLIGAGPFHLVGWLPVGNTGGADVSPTLPMPIPPDLRPYFEGYSLRNGFLIRGLVFAPIALVSILFYGLQ